MGLGFVLRRVHECGRGARGDTGERRRRSGRANRRQMARACQVWTKPGAASTPSRSSGMVRSMLGHFDPHLTQMIIDEETCRSINSRAAPADQGQPGDERLRARPRRPDHRLGWSGLRRAAHATRRADRRDVCLDARSCAHFAGERLSHASAGGCEGKDLYRGDRRSVVGLGHLRAHTHLGLVKVLCSRATVDLQQILVRTMERSKARPG